MIRFFADRDEHLEHMFAQAVHASSDPSWSASQTRRLRAMVEDHWVSLGRIGRSLGVPEAEIDDALQQVYIVAASKLDTIEPGKERAYLVQVAVHVAARVRRRTARSRETLGEADALETSASDAKSAEEVVDRAKAMEALGRILDGIDDDAREVFVLYEIEEMTMAEIAATLAIAAGTVASRLRRAREQFERGVARLRRAPRMGGPR